MTLNMLYRVECSKVQAKVFSFTPLVPLSHLLRVTPRLQLLLFSLFLNFFLIVIMTIILLFDRYPLSFFASVSPDEIPHQQRRVLTVAVIITCAQVQLLRGLEFPLCVISTSASTLSGVLDTTI